MFHYLINIVLFYLNLCSDLRSKYLLWVLVLIWNNCIYIALLFRETKAWWNENEVKYKMRAMLLRFEQTDMYTVVYDRLDQLIIELVWLFSIHLAQQ